MRVRKVTSRGIFSRGKPIASGTPSSTRSFASIQDGLPATVTMFFVREADDGSGKWEEFGIELTKAEYELFKNEFEYA